MARSGSKAIFTALPLVLAATGALFVGQALRPEPRGRGSVPPRVVSFDPPGALVESTCADQRLAKPTGETTGLGCDEVRRVMRQIHLRFPAPIVPPDPARFAEGVSDWLESLRLLVGRERDAFARGRLCERRATAR